MPKQHEPAPMNQDQAAAARAAMEAAVEAVKQQAVTNPVVSPKETVIRGRTFVRYSRKQRVRKRNQQPAFVWHVSPGMLKLGKTSEWALQDNAKSRGVTLVDGEVQLICVGNFNDDDLLYIWVVDENDPDAFEVKRNDEGYQEANIAEYLFDKGKVPQPGVKRKYNLLPAPELIDGKPALCIYLDKPIKTGTFATTKKKKASTTPKGPENKGPETEDADA
jgi:hypothetical protein